MQHNITLREKDNGWQVIVSYKVGRKWKQKSKQGFKRRREAKEYANELIEELKKTITNPLDDSLKHITLQQFYEIYQRDNKQRTTYNTLIAYNNAIKAFSPLLNMELVDITHADILMCINAMPYSVTTKNMYLRILKSVLKYAVTTYRIINTSPVKDIKQIKTRNKRELDVFTESECIQLLNSLKERHISYYIACAIARYTGARYGEVLGLSWNDVDFVNRTITINKQLAKISSNTFGIKEPKTKNSIRVIPIPPVLITILKEYRQQQGNNYSILPLKKSNTSAINTMIRSIIKGKSFHDLRHTYATILLSNGVDIKTVSALLGDTVDLVIKVYVHYTEEMKLKATQQVAKIFG